MTSLAPAGIESTARDSRGQRQDSWRQGQIGGDRQPRTDTHGQIEQSESTRNRQIAKDSRSSRKKRLTFGDSR